MNRMRSITALAFAAAALAGACSGDAPLGSSAAGPDGGPGGMLAAVLSPGSTFPGDRVRTTDRANIRSGPAVSASLVGVQPNGAAGSIVAGPVVDATGDRLTRWQVNFDSGPDGWAADAYLDQPSAGPAIASVTIAPASLALRPGDTTRLTATARDAAGQAVGSAVIAWSSSNGTAVSLSASGLVTGLAAGAATITASSRGVSGSAAVSVNRFVVGARVQSAGGTNVRSGPAASATLLGAQPDAAPGVVVGGPVVDAAGDRLTRWQVDFDTGPDGWAAESYLAASTAAPMAAAVAVAPDSATVMAGGSVQLSAVAKDAAGTTLPSAPMNWASLDTTRAKVAVTGLVTAVAAGTALITAQSGNRADTARLTVTPVPVVSVTVTPATASVVRGATVQLTATPRDSAGAALAGRSVAWSSSSVSVATVSAAGLVSGIAGGTATITATSGGRSGTAALTVTVPAPVINGKFVSPTGTVGGDGTRDRPWDLAGALSGAGGRVLPGDTVWLRGGIYRGSFRTTVNGQPGRPIVFRQYPGERATIDGAGTPGSSQSVWYVNAPYTEFWGFEITNSDGGRTTTSLGNDVRPNMVANYSSHTRYVNLVIHDGGVAFYNEANASDVEIAGSIMYNNGWQAPDRGHGHALYLKSNGGPVIARDNVVFNQFGYGVHVYSNAGSGLLNNIRLEGNVAFNNGTLATNSTSANILLGGDATSTGGQVQDNLTYFSDGVGGTNVRIGYGTTRNGSVDVRNNLFVGGTPVVDVGYWSGATFAGNTFVGANRVVTLNDPATSGQSWSLNLHQRDPLAAAWRYGGSTYNFATWRLQSTLGLTDLVAPGLPLGSRVVVRRNPYETGRAHVVVYNWTGSGPAIADLGGVLAPGDRYEVRNVQDVFGAPVASGTYAGPISLPMNGVAPPVPAGMSSSRAPRTGPYFDAFVVVKVL